MKNGALAHFCVHKERSEMGRHADNDAVYINAFSTSVVFNGKTRKENDTVQSVFLSIITVKDDATSKTRLLWLGLKD